MFPFVEQPAIGVCRRSGYFPRFLLVFLRQRLFAMRCAVGVDFGAKLLFVGFCGYSGKFLALFILVRALDNGRYPPKSGAFWRKRRRSEAVRLCRALRSARSGKAISEANCDAFAARICGSARKFGRRNVIKMTPDKKDKGFRLFNLGGGLYFLEMKKTIAFFFKIAYT
jgi:hypothetical protein